MANIGAVRGWLLKWKKRSHEVPKAVVRTREEQINLNALFAVQDGRGYLEPPELQRFGELVGKNSQMYAGAERKAHGIPLLKAILKEHKPLDEEQLTRLGELVGFRNKIYLDAKQISQQYRG
ncbi:MAG: hypothetical protein HYW05_02040 [Candidatus Diapherotrites archaeon]|nr:hypothetical protein [Candidatus Diapherotrites archaeon]